MLRHNIQLVNRIVFLLITSINFLSFLLGQFLFYIPQPLQTKAKFLGKVIRLWPIINGIFFKYVTKIKSSGVKEGIHVGIFDSDGGFLGEGILENKILLLALPIASSVGGGLGSE